MPIYNKESKLSEIILYDPSVIQVFNRFGIYLGVGDSTIKSSCEINNIDELLLLAIINTYLNRNYFPEGILGRINLYPLLNYLEKTDKYYKDVLLPNIERHFSLLISKSEINKKNSNLHLLQKFFWEVKAEMMEVIDNDLENWFPALRSNRYLEKISDKDFFIKKPYDNNILEEKIEDLLSFFVVHLKGEYDQNLCVAVISALNILQKDIQQNNRIRNRILKPLCQE